MNDDYLWDQSGPPDPETVRLEETLAPFRYRTRPLDLQRAPRHVPRGAAGKAWRWMAAAAAVVAGAIAVRLMTPPAREGSAEAAARVAAARKIAQIRQTNPC